MRVQIASFDPDTAFSLMQSKRLHESDVIELAPGVTARYETTYFRKAVGLPEISSSVIEVAGGTAAGVAAAAIWNWLERLQPKRPRITINRFEVHLDKSEVTRMIIEQIDIQDEREPKSLRFWDESISDFKKAPKKPLED